MANLETQILDDVIVKSRRKLMTLGATALAGMIVGTSTKEAHAATYNDSDILNFALNLEYLEGNFYYLAAFGCTIDAPNAAAKAAGAPTAGIPINKGSVGTAGTVSGGSKVPFATIAYAAYANETAIEEGKHVLFLQSALGVSSYVNQPAINLGTAWQGLGAALTPSAPTFTPYDNEIDFLLGAYVFEDVGVTAYHGAASLLTTPAYLAAAAGILGVEAYHAGLVRTAISAIDPAGTGIGAVAQAISTLRATLSKAGRLGVAAGPYDSDPDDFGTAPYSVSITGASYTSTRITNADPVNSIAFSRNTTQVL
ncbi:MAG: ferritin-like domain-containing protein, partial [Bryocella sp.]